MKDEYDRYIPDAIVELEKNYLLIADGEELGFSWKPCDWCHGLAGDRYKGITHRRNADPKKDWNDWQICSDCIQYAANGELCWEDN